jgi:hypothetical protein
MATFTFFNSFKEALPEKAHNLGSDTLKWMLTNVAPVATNTVKADLTEIAAGFGYTAGGATVAASASSQTGGTYSLVLAAATFTAAAGDFAPFRYIVLYNDTAASDELIGWLDYGTSYTLTDTNTFTIPAGTAFTLA